MLKKVISPDKCDGRKTVLRNIILFIPVAIVLYQLLWIPIPAFFVLVAVLYGGFVGASTAQSLRAQGIFGVPFWTIVTPTVAGYLAGLIFGFNELSDEIPRTVNSPVRSWLSSHFCGQSIAWALMGGILGSIIGIAIVGLRFVARVTQRTEAAESGVHAGSPCTVKGD